MNCLARRLTIAVAIALGSTFQQLSSEAAALRTVALSGQPTPRTPAGVTYGSFGAYFVNPASKLTFRGPVINDAGRIAFRANLAGVGVDSTNNQGIWSEGSGSLALVARTGSAAPGAPDGSELRPQSGARVVHAGAESAPARPRFTAASPTAR